MNLKMDYRNPCFVEVTAYVLLVFACENVMHTIFNAKDQMMKSISLPVDRFFWFEVEKVLKDKQYIEPLNSSDTESNYVITPSGRVFANSYRVQNNIDLSMDPKEVIMSIYIK